VFSSSFRISLLVCFVGCCLPILRQFDLTLKAFVAEFELVTLFPAIFTSDYNSAYLTSASFR